jgi:hypothetical protein
METVALVQLRHALLSAQADRVVALFARAVEQRLHQLGAEAGATTTGDDRDCQLGRLLVDEAEAGCVARKQAIPRCPDRAGLPRDQSGVAGAAPVVDVPCDRKIRILVQAPVVRVAQHVPQEADVLRPRLANHDGSVRPRYLE